MLRIESEWDIRANDLIFVNMDAAISWLQTSEIIGELADDNETSLEKFIEEGLISFQPVQLIQ